MTANEEFLQGTGVIKMLLVGIDGYRNSAFDTQMSNPVEGVVSRASTTNDEDAWIWHAKCSNLFVHESGCTALGFFGHLIHHVGECAVISS